MTARCVLCLLVEAVEARLATPAEALELADGAL